jgi:hypothetical protein
MALKRLCPKCKKLIDYTMKYCDECAERYSKEKAESNRTYDKSVRKSDNNLKYYEFYHGKEWKLVSNEIKRKYNSLCLACLLQDDEVNVYDVIHHLYEIKTDTGWKHRLNKDLLIPLCHRHHNGLSEGEKYTDAKRKMLIELIKEYEEIYG